MLPGAVFSGQTEPNMTGNFLPESHTAIELGFFERLMCLIGFGSKTDIRVHPVTNYHERGCQYECDSSKHTQRGSDGKIIRHTIIHTGMDIGGKMGDSIYAAHSGTVKVERSVKEYNDALARGVAAKNMSQGIYITVTSVDQKISTLYAHLSDIIVGSGYVSAGTKIAKMGTSGNSSGLHLHFEVKVGSRLVDPTDFLHYRAK